MLHQFDNVAAYRSTGDWVDILDFVVAAGPTLKPLQSLVADKRVSGQTPVRLKCKNVHVNIYTWSHVPLAPPITSGGMPQRRNV